MHRHIYSYNQTICLIVCTYIQKHTNTKSDMPRTWLVHANGEALLVAAVLTLCARLLGDFAVSLARTHELGRRVLLEATDEELLQDTDTVRE